MGNHIHSSLVCAARLLRLAGVNAEPVETLGKNAAIDLSTGEHSPHCNNIYHSYHVRHRLVLK